MTGARFFSPVRFMTLLMKEFRQMICDPATIFLGTILPVILILLFGWGLSMDLTKVPAAIVEGESTPLARAVTQEFVGSRYFDITTLKSRTEAEALLSARRIEAIIDIPQGFEEDASRGEGAIGLTIHGVDASAATIIRTYAKAAIALLQEKIALRGDGAAMTGVSGGSARGGVMMLSRSWFNEANTSAWYLVPGLSIVVLTLSASFLGSIVIAREWERGTMETLSITPATSFEIVLSKFLANYALITVGSLLTFLTAVLIFDAPVRGSLLLLALTILFYTAWAISFGLFLSAFLKSQFVAIQLAVIGSYLPSLILSGYLFDLRSVPAFISAVGHLMPPTYAIESVKILYLSGGPEHIVLSNLAILAAWVVLFLALALATTKKRLD